MLYLTNAFSMNMFELQDSLSFRITRVEYPLDILMKEQFVSAIGHQDLANILTDMWELDIPYNRISLKLSTGDTCLIAQYVGPRLEEGTTTLPDGATIQFAIVEFTEGTNV